LPPSKSGSCRTALGVATADHWPHHFRLICLICLICLMRLIRLIRLIRLTPDA
jgi:hypothetical protein